MRKNWIKRKHKAQRCTLGFQRIDRSFSKWVFCFVPNCVKKARIAKIKLKFEERCETSFSAQFWKQVPHGFPKEFTNLNDSTVYSFCGFQKNQVSEVADVANDGTVTFIIWVSKSLLIDRNSNCNNIPFLTFHCRHKNCFNTWRYVDMTCHMTLLALCLVAEGRPWRDILRRQMKKFIKITHLIIWLCWIRIRD